MLPSLREEPQRLGEYLLARGLISQDMLTAALAEQRVTHDKLGLILSRNGFISRRQLVAAILEISPNKIHGEQHFTMRIPLEVLLEHRIMIVAEHGDRIHVATPTPERIARKVIQQYYPSATVIFEPFNHEQLDAYLENVKSMLQDEKNLVERLLRRALAESVSDVHIVPRFASYSVLFRHLGVRRLVHEGSLDEYNTLSARLKDMSRMDLAERRLPQDGSFVLEYNGKMVDMRVATEPTVSGEYLIIRLLDPDSVQPNLSGLGITRLEEWRKAVSRSDGLCLVCGPTGSGKTTTLNATIKEMDRFGRAIFTIEDPVEYRMPFVGQVNANAVLGLDFARAVKSFMRADPDVIILGEVRDPETARNAVKAADTGHLVLATLHTNSIRSAVSRLRDLGVAPEELRYLLRGVLVQRLVRTICPECGGKGCPGCFNSTYAGRTVVSECAYFPGEKDVSELLHTNKVWWPTMMEDCVRKVEAGLTTADEAIRVFGADAQDALGLQRSATNVPFEVARDDLEVSDEDRLVVRDKNADSGAQFSRPEQPDAQDREGR